MYHDKRLGDREEGACACQLSTPIKSSDRHRRKARLRERRTSHGIFIIVQAKYTAGSSVWRAGQVRFSRERANNDPAASDNRSDVMDREYTRARGRSIIYNSPFVPFRFVCCAAGPKRKVSFAIR